MTRKLILLLAIGCGLNAGCAKEAEKKIEPIPICYADIADISLMVESTIKKEEYSISKVRLINPTSLPVSFWGYSVSQPFYVKQEWVDGNWEGSTGWCGTGMRQCVIPPGQSSVLTFLKAMKNSFP